MHLFIIYYAFIYLCIYWFINILFIDLLIYLSSLPSVPNSLHKSDTLSSLSSDASTAQKKKGVDTRFC